MPTIQDSRILIKSSTVASTVPTIPISNDHTDGTWLITDIYKGEVFINQADDKVFTRTAGGIIQIYPPIGLPTTNNKVTSLTTIALLEDDANWADNQYTGIGISGQGEGDWYINETDGYYYKFNDASDVIRINYVTGGSGIGTVQQLEEINPSIVSSGGIEIWEFDNTLYDKYAQCALYEESTDLRLISIANKVTDTKIRFTFYTGVDIDAGTYRACVQGVQKTEPPVEEGFTYTFPFELS